MEYKSEALSKGKRLAFAFMMRFMRMLYTHDIIRFPGSRLRQVTGRIAENAVADAD
jgi:hypothetical protein